MLQVSKRFFVTLPDSIGDALDRWASAERNKPATLAAFLLEQSIRAALDEGKIPPTPNYKNLKDLLTRNDDVLTEYGKIPANRISAMKKGDRPTELEIARLALALRIDEDYISSLVGSDRPS